MKRADILIVEDEPIIYKRLKMLLKEHHYKVDDFTPSFDEALKKINIKRPDLVLLDIDLKGEKTGIDLGKVLHSKYKIPFIYLTSYGDDQTFFESLRTHHEQFIVKSKSRLNEQEILRAIQTVLYRYEESSFFVKDGIIGLVDYLHIINSAGKGEVTRVPVPYSDIAFFTVRPFTNQDGEEEDLNANYVWFKTKKEYFFLRSSLIELTEKLPQNFVRINDSYIVNISSDILNGRINGSRLSVLNQDFVISERYKREVKKRFDMFYN